MPDHNRRRFLKLAGAGSMATVTGLAGCSGDGDGNGDTGGDTGGDSGGDTGGDTGGTDTPTPSEGLEGWPPVGGRVDMVGPGGAADVRFLYNQIYAEYLSNYLESGDQIEVTASPLGGNNIQVGNRVWNADPDGSFLASGDAVGLLSGAVFTDFAQYNPRDFNWVAQAYGKTRTLILNHRTMPIDTHFDIGWDEFVELFPDIRWASVGENHQQTWFIRTVAELHPDLDRSVLEDNLLFYNGGDAARTAIEQEEADGYLGSFSGQIARGNFYKIQFVATDPRYEGFVESIHNFAEDEGWNDPKTLGSDTTFSEENAQFISDIVQDGLFWVLPPDVPQEVVQMWWDTFEEAQQDEDLISDVGEVIGDPQFTHNPVSGEAAAERAIGLYDIRTENEDFLRDVKSS